MGNENTPYQEAWGEPLFETQVPKKSALESPTSYNGNVDSIKGNRFSVSMHSRNNHLSLFVNPIVYRTAYLI